MGRIFLEHMGGGRLFSCVSCDANLTNRSELISTRFTGATGRAFLFNKVVNLSFSDIQDRVMLTGRHMVRDISCKNCDAKLGWIYEFATEESQRYKEGRVILERALVRETEGFANDDTSTAAADATGSGGDNSQGSTGSGTHHHHHHHAHHQPPPQPLPLGHP